MNTTFKKVIIGASVAASLAAISGTANASHFRGAAYIPVVDANGLLTVTSTTFWRKGTASSTELRPTVTGLGLMSTTGNSTDSSDSRYDVNTATYTMQLSGAGTYAISGGSCCRVASGTSLANWSQSSETMNAAIVWDGINAANPINFSFATLQSEVSRLAGNDYSQNLNATSADGYTLTYDQALNQNINSQIPGFTVDTTTGQLTIVGDANRAQITDNTLYNAGADAAFSGNIFANDGGSFVEFDWMFDGVNAAANQAPTVDDATINALVGGGPISYTFTGMDPEDASVTWDPQLVLGAGFDFATPTFDVNTQLLSWDTTGYSAGSYLIQARAFDSQNVGDYGLLTVNLSDNTTLPPSSVPEPGTLLLLGLGFAGLSLRSKRR